VVHTPVDDIRVRGDGLRTAAAGERCWGSWVSREQCEMAEHMSLRTAPYAHSVLGALQQRSNLCKWQRHSYRVGA
jgi:hypothetical protein